MDSKYIGKWNIEIHFNKEGIETIKTTCDFFEEDKIVNGKKKSNMRFTPPIGMTAQDLYELMNNPENELRSIVLISKCHAKTAQNAN